MENNPTLQKITRLAAQALCRFIEQQLPSIGGDNWWETHVFRQLSYSQQGHIRTKGINDLSKLDLAALLRVFDRNWGELSFTANLSSEVKTHFKEIGDIRNQMAHLAAEGSEIPDADAYRCYDTLHRAMTAIQADADLLQQIRQESLACITRMAGGLTEPKTVTIEKEVIREVPVEVIKEFIREVPVEVIKEVIREVPVEVIREVRTQGSYSAEKEPEGGLLIGKLRIHGPGEEQTGKLVGFDGQEVEATLIAWNVYGDGGLHFSIQVAMIDEGTAAVVGQVVCISRNQSPQTWDDVVERLRIGIRDAGEGQWIMDLRSVERGKDGRVGRKVWSLAEYQSKAGINLQQTLKQLGAIAVDKREALIDDKSRNRNIPAVLFQAGDAQVPAAALVLTTLAPLL
jgi:hypothetical protein